MKNRHDMEQLARDLDVERHFLESTEQKEKEGAPLAHYARQLAGKTCKWCGRGLPSTIEHYDHSGGFRVQGFTEKQWLFVTCGCDYQWSLWKLDVEEKQGRNEK